jgi:hypothetical protein
MSDMVVFNWKVDKKKCNFVNLPFMTIDEVLLYEKPNVMPFMGMDIGDGFNFTLILVWGR